jgi:glycine/D-amino acid oxidase-like deaminating enzyme
VNERVFDDNTSVWLEGAPEAEAGTGDVLARDVNVDVAIIGGGFTGVSTAYHFSRRFPGLGVALLEAKRLANGASGRNGGLVLNGISILDDDVELAVREHAVTRAAIDGIERVIAEHGLAVRFRRDGVLAVATSTRAAEDAHARVEKLAARGLPLRYVAGATGDTGATGGGMRGVCGAVLDPTEGVLNGVDLIRAMRPVLVAQGVQIWEHTPVVRVREGKVVELETPRATVRAKAIVLATSGYTPRLGYFKSGLLPVISHVIATEPVAPEVLERSGLAGLAGFHDDRPRLAYCSVTAERRVVFGGGTTASYGYRFGNATTYDARMGDGATRALRASITGYLPELGGVKLRYRWSGPLDLTLARHCGMGVRGEHENVYYALGYSGHGITLANLAGHVLADLYEGNHDAWRDCAFYMKRPSGIPPEPLRWLGYHAYTQLTGRSPWKRGG